MINASNDHYDTLRNSIKNLIANQDNLELTLTIKFKGVSVDLNISESLIVINTLAVKRAAIRGSSWSAAGKGVEKPLMQVICELYKVSKKNYSLTIKDEEIKEDISIRREVDFYLKSNNNLYKCEIKLMGGGNPESADSAIARGSDVFIADKLSEKNKENLTNKGIQWVELRTNNGFRKFSSILQKFEIQYEPLEEISEKELENIFKKLFSQKP